MKYECDECYFVWNDPDEELNYCPECNSTLLFRLTNSKYEDVFEIIKELCNEHHEHVVTRDVGAFHITPYVKRIIRLDKQ